MVPAMDTFTKSSPALSQTSEGEERERKKIEVGEEKRLTETNIQRRKNRNSRG